MAGGEAVMTGAPVSGEDFLHVSNVTKSYDGTRIGRVVAVDPIDLAIKRGEFASIIGPSGCGKSTLLMIMGGMQRPSGGTVTIGGKIVDGPLPDRAAFVFQDYTLFPWRTVAANVEVGLQFRGIRKPRRRDMAMKYLTLVNLAQFADAYPAELSGGMQQRVAIARALALEPEVLLMDEPFGALDEQMRAVLGDELLKIFAKTGQTVVFVTHSLSEAIYLSDRIVVMTARPGKIKEILTVPAPRPRDASFVTSDLFNELRKRLFTLLNDEAQAAARLEIAEREVAEKGNAPHTARISS
jgi:NitT/TauT family transport system ATP-binding protein